MSDGENKVSCFACFATQDLLATKTPVRERRVRVPREVSSLGPISKLFTPRCCQVSRQRADFEQQKLELEKKHSAEMEHVLDKVRVFLG